MFSCYTIFVERLEPFQKNTEKRGLWRFRVPEIPHKKESLPLERKYAELEDLVGKQSYEVVRLIAEQLFFNGIKVPVYDDGDERFFENPYYLLFRFYRAGEHLKQGKIRLLKDASDEPEVGLGIGEILNSTLNNFFLKQGGRGLYKSNGYNRLAIENKVVFHKYPDYQRWRDGKKWKDYLFARNDFQLSGLDYSLSSRERKNLNRLDVYHKPSKHERVGYFMFVDFLVGPTEENIQLIREAFQLRIYDQGIPLEGVLVKSSEKGMHFIGTNLIT